MNIAIVGTGYVGLVTGTCFSEMGVDVTCVDINEAKIKALQGGVMPIYEPGLESLVLKNVEAGRLHFTTDLTACLDNVSIVFSAVGTPPDEDGSADLRYVLDVARTVGRSINKYTLLVTKSTVPVGTAQKVKAVIQEELDKRGVAIPFDVASNPEFLKEGAAIKDFMAPDRVVVGIESGRAKKLMEKLYRPFTLNGYPLLIMDLPSAEMTKYAANAMLATRISFMNDIANLCEIVGANIEDVSKGMSYDERIGSKFLKAGIGYGGSCFPKDTKALHWLASHNGYELKTVKAAIEVNESQKLRLVRKAANLVESFDGMKVCVLGLTFKPETDDLREAPSIPNIQYLLERGAEVVAYDPVGIENAKKIFKDSITYTTSIDEAIKDADICFIMTEWKQILNYDISNYKNKMKRPLVFDGRNCYTLDTMKDLGIEYYSIGR